MTSYGQIPVHKTKGLDAVRRGLSGNDMPPLRGRTVVVVAHRLSTVKNADRIIVLDHGNIVESGNHDSLIRDKGTYYNLVKNQLELGD